MLSKVVLLFTVLALVAADSGNDTITTTATPANSTTPANITTTAVPLNVTETSTSTSTTAAPVTTSTVATANTTTSQAETTTSTTTVATSTTTGQPDGSTWFVKGYLCKLTLFKQINIRYTSCSDKKSNDTSVATGKGGN